MIPLDDLRIGARLLWRLPGFLRAPVRPDRARAILRDRLERREEAFLNLMRRSVYDFPESPHRQLLAGIGCGYEDLARLVGREGLEGALHALFRQGVYLTVNEFKGRKPIVRGSMTIAANPTLFRNPLAVVHIPAQTSGSRGKRTPVGIDLAHIRDEAVDLSLFFAARGGGRWVHAYCGVPGGSAVRGLLRLGCAGAAPRHWYSHVDPSSVGIDRRYRWSVRIVQLGSWLAGTPFGGPRCVPPDAPQSIVSWLADLVRNGFTPHLWVFASPAVRICQAALRAGIDIRGAEFTLGGEPITAARMATITRAGVRAVPHYSSVETGHIGYGCLASQAPDDLHVLSDLHAVIQAGGQNSAVGLSAGSILVTSLRPTSPYVLLNVSPGNQAALVDRSCGCPLERLGWRTHMHTIRSREKLTAGGMTFLDTDVIRVLEVILPGRFGGSPTDYQLVEEEGRDGQPRLSLLVHPSVGPLDTSAVADAFLSAIGGGSGAERVMALHWRDAGLLRVERRAPLVTASGKILHLHQSRREERGA